MRTLITIHGWRIFILWNFNYNFKYYTTNKADVDGEKLCIPLWLLDVDDMALLRAKDIQISSTHRGYIIEKNILVSRIFKVQHSDEDVQDELESIVDMVLP